MLTQEQADLLTKTGPGSPCGDLLRRYWQPVALSDELPTGAAPLAVKILGEDLVLFRDEQGRPSLLGLHCGHRGTDLSYGRIENGGLRCLYHGWLYDTKGRCLEQPGEPRNSQFKDKIRHPAYPCQEKVGVIFTYMGPGEPPLLPGYEFLTVPTEHVYAAKLYNECNYLQGNEGNIDPVHLSFLHAFWEPQEAGKGELNYIVLAQAGCPELEIEETDFRVRIYAARKMDAEQVYLRITNFVFPNLSAVAGALQDGYLVNWHVPIDDTHHWKYMMHFTRNGPIDRELMDRILFQGPVPSDHRLPHNQTNRYLQNRERMKWNFSGVGETARGSFPAQDLLVTESQGPIWDRTREQLGYTDKAIIAARWMMLRAIQQVKAGEDPPHVARDAVTNVFPHLAVRSEMVPASADWKTWREKAEEGRRTRPGAL